MGGRGERREREGPGSVRKVTVGEVKESLIEASLPLLVSASPATDSCKSHQQASSSWLVIYHTTTTGSGKGKARWIVEWEGRAVQLVHGQSLTRGGG
jgi:hypothetical protein